MATTIDSLVIELGLDARQLNQQTRDALEGFKQTIDQAKRYGTEVEKQGKSLLSVYSGFKRVALGIATTFLGMGVKEFVGYMTNLEAATGRVAKTMDVSAAELSIWQGAAERLGGSAEGITGTLQGISSEINKFSLTGQSSWLGVMTQLGLSFNNLNGQLKNPMEFFMDAVKAVEGMDPARARSLLSMMGLDQNAVNMAIIGQQRLQATLNETSKALHGGLSPEDVKVAQEYQGALKGVEQSYSTLGKTLLTITAPALTAIGTAMSHLAENQLNESSKPGYWEGGGFGKFSYWVDDLTGGRLHRMFGKSDADFAKERSGAEASNFGAGGAPVAAPSASGSGSGNWTNFLSGLSYLETSQHGGGNATSSAQGFFQFLTGTANAATAQGLSDPRAGSYDDQAAATRAFIQKNTPAAASAIERGDFAAAALLLNKTWPSLPGGSQPQSMTRYRTWIDELSGGGPRPPGHSWLDSIGASGAAAVKHPSSSIDNRSTHTDKSTSVHIGQVTTHVHGAKNADDVAKGIPDAVRRATAIGSWNTGLA